MKKYLMYITFFIGYTTCLQAMLTPSPYSIATLYRYIFDIFMHKEHVYPPCLQACMQEETPEILKTIILASTQQELNTRDDAGNTCLHYICCSHDPKIITLIPECIQKGACPYITNYTGDTPLHHACKKRNSVAVQELLNNNILVNYKNNSGLTPLFYTLINTDYDTAQLLLQRKAHTELRNNKNETPLFYACKKGMRPFVKLLLCAGANPNSTCNGITPHSFLAQKKHYTTYALQNRLLEFGALITNNALEGDEPCSLLKDGIPHNFKDYGNERIFVLKRLLALQTDITHSQNHIFWCALQAAQLSEQQLHNLCNHALYLKKPEIKNTIFAFYFTKHPYPLDFPDIIIKTVQ